MSTMTMSLTDAVADLTDRIGERAYVSIEHDRGDGQEYLSIAAFGGTLRASDHPGWGQVAEFNCGGQLRIHDRMIARRHEVDLSYEDRPFVAYLWRFYNGHVQIVVSCPPTD